MKNRTDFNSWLDEIAKRAENATDGPWTTDASDYVGFVGEQFFVVVGGKPDADGDLDCVCPGRVKLENANFIAHARSDVPALLRGFKYLLSELQTYVPLQELERIETELAKLARGEKT